MSAKLLIQFNTGSCCEHITGVGNMYLYGCVTLITPVCAMYLCVRYNIRVLAKHYIMCQTSVNLTSYCIKHTARSFWYHMPRLDVYRAFFIIYHNIKQNNASNVTESPIEPKNQDNKKAVGVEVGGGGGRKKFEKIGGVELCS